MAASNLTQKSKRLPLSLRESSQLGRNSPSQFDVAPIARDDGAHSQLPRRVRHRRCAKPDTKIHCLTDDVVGSRCRLDERVAMFSRVGHAQNFERRRDSTPPV